LIFFAVGSFVVHNYVNLNIGLNLTLQQAAAYFVEWTVTGLVIGLLYRPVVPHWEIPRFPNRVPTVGPRPNSQIGTRQGKN
jgi:hypothetical protein